MMSSSLAGAPDKARIEALGRALLAGEATLAEVRGELLSAAGNDRVRLGEIDKTLRARLRTPFATLARRILGLGPKADLDRRLVAFGVAVLPNVILKARAGSGKSTALLLKTAFLVEVLGVPPEAVMLLVFNRSAREDLEAKLRAASPIWGPRVRVLTFHKLAFRLLMAAGVPPGAVLFDESTERTASSEESRLAAVRETVLSRVEQALEEESRYFDLMDGPYGYRLDVREVAERVMKAMALLRVRNQAAAPAGRSGFRDLAARAAVRFDRELEARGLLDDVLCLREAVRLLSDQQRRFPFVEGLQVLLADEYQDASLHFVRLMKELQARNRGLLVNAVGDDWQAINGFAGSETRHYRSFASDFPPAMTSLLPVNRRSGAAIVRLGNAVMEGEGAPAEWLEANGPGEIALVASSRTFDAEDPEEAIAWMVRVIRDRHPEQASLGVLARTNRVLGLPLSGRQDSWDARLRREFAARKGPAPDRLDLTSCHRAKGLEWDHVVLLDVGDGAFPFSHPSRHHLKDLVPDAEHREEERRLLYVACTRAKARLTLLQPRISRRGRTVGLSPLLPKAGLPRLLRP